MTFHSFQLFLDFFFVENQVFGLKCLNNFRYLSHFVMAQSGSNSPDLISEEGGRERINPLKKIDII